MMHFFCEHRDRHTQARAGTLSLPHGDVLTPAFMPVGTQGAVKALTVQQLHDLEAQIILGNTYHLFLRPGCEVIRTAQGLHRFTGWPGPILTDSGGYQIYSLAELRELTDEGVVFKSHIDGTAFAFTPEQVVAMQEAFGVDIMMQLDDCPPSGAGRDRIAEAVERSLLWAQRSARAWSRSDSALFGIVQGGLHPDLRQKSAQSLIGLDLPGYALGGFSVGEAMEHAYPVIAMAAACLPQEKPRYLMGVGFPEDIVRAVGFGIDMFDCVMPTRNARNGMCFYAAGRLKIKNSCYRDDMQPIDPACSCYACRHFSRAYLRHLFMADEITALVLMTIHNVHYYLDLCRQMRAAIIKDQFSQFCDSFFQALKYF